MNIRCSLFALACALPSLVSAQAAVAPTATTPMSVAGSVTLPPNTMVEVTPVVEITSKKMKEGDKVAFQVVKDVVHNGAVVIPRGAPLQSTISRNGAGSNCERLHSRADLQLSCFR